MSHRLVGRRERGFTLIELLIAMGLFTLLGVAVVLLMRTGVDMWIGGTRGAQQEERVEQSLPRFEDDMRMMLVPRQRDRIPFDPKEPDPEKEPAPLMPDNRLVSGHHFYNIGRRDQPERCRFLAFVRDITGMGELDVWLDRAGTNSKAEAYIDGINDEVEFKKNLHLPTGGAAEVLWVFVPDAKLLGVGTVYRAYRTPIGGKDTLLDPANYDTFDELMKKVKPQAMFQGVTLFEILFWTQYTTTWEWSRGEPRVTERPQELTKGETGRPQCGPSRTWDSTRGIMVKKDGNYFRLTKGEKSARFSADDIWPRMIRVEFALNEDEVPLMQPLAANDQVFTVTVPDFATGHGDLFARHMKIGTEWIRLRGRDGRSRNRFEIDQRGVRDTETVPHPVDTPVRFGRILDVTIVIPSFRDDNN
ncbi:MAG: PulJ/GspJ family protein [Planctomycetota bacterium]|jgi:prepilin-type N-terminal cleavage/methylation domain-containing protein